MEMTGRMLIKQLSALPEELLDLTIQINCISSEHLTAVFKLETEEITHLFEDDSAFTHVSRIDHDDVITPLKTPVLLLTFSGQPPRHRR